MNNNHTESLPSIFTSDPILMYYQKKMTERIKRVQETELRLTNGQMSISEFASGHEYFGLHKTTDSWIFREWAPNATAIYLIGNMTDWQEKSEFALTRINDQNIWELRVPLHRIHHQDYYRLRVHWNNGCGDRIPSYARRVVKDLTTTIFNAQVWAPSEPYVWKCNDFKCPKGQLLIYESHVGMAQEQGKVSSYKEFTKYTIPKIVEAGYNTIQLMAIAEHPYYGSFGYHVTSLFAATSQFGTPDDLKELIDTAHSAGLAVIMDIIHSHSVKNETEGLSRFDGTLYQYFHDGERGYHHAWDSRCFDYGKIQVLHFLLSNCRFWIDEYHFDGFRFDGITSMLYLHHGLGANFFHYDQYFDDAVDEYAVTYLTLANKVIHQIKSDAITIAEDISGMPGLAYSLDGGGIGFDYRFAMGIADTWIKVIKENQDERWPIGTIWHELTNRRQNEKSISYAESHDQAIVGDKTIIFRLLDKDMYYHMSAYENHTNINRGLALHKMIRLLTLITAGNGYLNFMGNEFGHPEWIDFPREGNNWSYHYARRQWSLASNPDLKYKYLNRFDQDMMKLVKQYNILNSAGPFLMYEHIDHMINICFRAGLIFIFNFHPTFSQTGYAFNAPEGVYEMLLNSDDKQYDGQNRLQPNEEHWTLSEEKVGYTRHYLSLYIPTRTAIVLKKK